MAILRDRRLPILIGSIVLLGLTGCREALPAPRLVLLYAPCTVSKRHLSPYGVEARFTPNLAAFAERAVVFDAHRTEAGSSGIAYASLFAGVQADRHGVFAHPKKLPADLHLITESFADHGYETFFWNNHGMASARLGYAQGVPREHVYPRPLKGGEERFQALLARLREDPQARAFVMTNFSVTHGPYGNRRVARFRREHPDVAAPAPGAFRRLVQLYHADHLAFSYNTRATLERLRLTDRLTAFASTIELLYRSNLSELDRLFGEVLEAIDAHGLRDESLVAFTADHGEVMYRETAVFPWTHSASLDRDVVEVPLLIAGPGIEPGRFGGVTRSIDVYPTLTALSGWSSGGEENGLAGRSLARALTGGRPPAPRPAYSHTGVTPEVVVRKMQAPGGQATWAERIKRFPRSDVALSWAAVRDGPWSAQLRNLDGRTWGTQVFDLRDDPDETRDVFDPNDPRHAALAEGLAEYKQRLVRAAGRPDVVPDPEAPDETEQEELLRGLGYIR